MHNKGIYERFIKRPQDLFCSLLALIVLSPLFIILVMFVQIKMGSPVLFTQDRPGKDGKIFKLHKFRTMTDQRDENGKLLADEQRLTKFGRFLRSTSLDELPALINILKGDMAVVGPRPLLVSYLERYDEHQARRHEVRPGLTGLAQISGRNALSWEDRFNLDVEYVDNISFLKDWKIIFKTVEIVLKKEGINSSTSTTMEEFKGSTKSKEV
jgi:undecaprenyl phosphate N,N'-diacetylbacillosamine 1-phosphate transferase